jgi:hypothetical protein
LGHQRNQRQHKLPLVFYWVYFSRGVFSWMRFIERFYRVCLLLLAAQMGQRFLGTPEKGIRRLDPNTANERHVVGPNAWLYSGQ